MAASLGSCESVLELLGDVSRAAISSSDHPLVELGIWELGNLRKHGSSLGCGKAAPSLLFTPLPPTWSPVVEDSNPAVEPVSSGAHANP